MIADNGTHTNSRHPIAVVSERTGLSQDVLRVWERRYSVVKPERGSGGQRLYTDEDVERLRLLHAATRGGRSIGQISEISNDELSRLVAEDLAAKQTLTTYEIDPHARETIDGAIELALSMDAAGLDALLRQAHMRLGTHSFVDQIAVPLLRHIGDEWHAGRLSVASEHLASTLIDGILGEALRVSTRARSGPSMLVCTPAGEHHGIGAVILGAIAAANQWRVVYLGTNLPAADIASAAATARVDVVALSLTYSPDSAPLLNELRKLRGALDPTIPIVVGGAGSEPIERELERIGVLRGETIDDLMAIVRR